jgi:hypothetical protein
MITSIKGWIGSANWPLTPASIDPTAARKTSTGERCEPKHHVSAWDAGMLGCGMLG